MNTILVYPLLAALTFSFFFWMKANGLQSELDEVNASMKLNQAQLLGCQGRLLNINEDKKSDDEIDLLNDSDLRVVPDHWLHKGEAN